MTYKKDFAVAVKCGGRVLTEVDSDPAVHLPFGSEYSVILKNLHGTRAQVQVFIDGKDVLYGKSIVLEPNHKIELERFVKDLSKGKRFKFVEKTDEVIAKHGDEADDSIIHVGYRFERPRVPIIPVPYVWPLTQMIPIWQPTFYSTRTDTGNISGNGAIGTLTCSSAGAVGQSESMVNVGKTVKGSSSHQSFSTTSVGALEDETHVINLIMRGYRSGVAVDEPEVVKKKVECFCGTISKKGNNFCRKCGEALNGKH